MEELEIKDTVLQNENPQILSEFYSTVSQFFINSGWYLLAFVLFLVYLYARLRPYLDSYLKQQADEEYAAKYHKNPDLYNARLTAMEESRRKMQESYNQIVDEHKIKMELKEELKRHDWIERQVNSKSMGNKLGRGNMDDNTKEKKSFKPEYNPLMGSSSGSNYRASKKSPCGGGGCGK